MITFDQAEKAAEAWQVKLLELEQAQGEVTTTPEEESAGDIFSKVLPVLHLHKEHDSIGCLSCGGSMDSQLLSQRIELCEMLIERAKNGKIARKRASNLEKTVATLEARALYLLENVDKPDLQAQDTDLYVQLGWSLKQLALLTANSRQLILQRGISTGSVSVLQNGTIFDVETQAFCT